MKLFPFADVLAVTTDRLVSPKHIDAVYEVLNFLTGDDLSTLQLPRAREECLLWLRMQFPQLMEDSHGMVARLARLEVAVEAHKADPIHNSPELWADIGKWVESVRLAVGLPEMLPLYELGDDMYTRIDPIEEARAMFGDGNVIGVPVDSLE